MSNSKIKKRRKKTKDINPQEMKDFGARMKELAEQTSAVEIKHLKDKGVID